MAMRPKLQKPYFYLDWDEGERIKVEARKADIDRFMTQWPEVQKRIEDLRAKSGDPNEADVQAVREAFRFLLGPDVGQALYDRCMAEVIGDDADLTETDCIYQLLPTVSYIADEWTAYALSMAHQRDENVERYLRRVRDEQAL